MGDPPSARPYQNVAPLLIARADCAPHRLAQVAEVLARIAWRAGGGRAAGVARAADQCSRAGHVFGGRLDRRLGWWRWPRPGSTSDPACRARLLVQRPATT